MAARNFVYVPGAVNGSSAYDFSHPDLAPDQYGRTKEQPETQTRTRVRTKPQVRPKTKQSVAPTAVIGMLIAGVLLVTMIMAKAQLMTISMESASLTSQLAAANTQQAKLQVTYETAFNFSEIEEYATKTLGMQKPSADQIIYLDTAATDRAFVIEDTGSLSAFDKFADFISSIGGLLG